MFLQTQDIVYLKGIKFKPDNIVDISLYGHPVLVIHITDTHFYFLTISSSSNNEYVNKNEFQHFPMRKTRNSKLKAPINYVNLKNIYKWEIGDYVPKGYINKELFKCILYELKNYQENIKMDELYDEINIDNKLDIKIKVRKKD